MAFTRDVAIKMFDGLISVLNTAQAGIDLGKKGKDLPLIGGPLEKASNEANNSAKVKQFQTLRDQLNTFRTEANNDSDYTFDEFAAHLTKAVNQAGFKGNDKLAVKETGEITYALDLSKGDTFTAPFDPGALKVGELLKFESKGSFSVTADAALKLVVGHDKDGFYIDTSDPAKSKFSVGVGASLDGSSLDATVGLLGVSAKDKFFKDTNNKLIPDAKISFDVGLVDPDKKMRLDEIIPSNFEPKLNGTVDLDLALTGRVFPQVKALDFLPTINADLRVDWTFTNSKAETKYVGFDNVKLDVSKLLGPQSLIGKVLKPVGEVAKIVKPVTDILTTEIAPLKAVGAPSTLLALVGADAGTVEAVKAINEVAGTLDKIAKISATGFVDLGNHKLTGTDPVKNPSASGSEQQKSGSTAAEIKGKLDELFATTKAPTTAAAPPAKTGFDFPILRDPKSALGILTGKTVDLVTYRLPELKLDLKFEKAFPLPIPIPVPIFVKLGGFVGVNGRLGFGFDTEGLNQFKESNWKSGEKLLNGLYIMDHHPDATDGNKVKDLPELEVKGGLTVAAGVDIGLASAYVGGGLEASVGLDFKDEDNDGKFRLGEKIASNFDKDLGAFLTESFEFKGSVSAFAYVEVSALWWEKRWEFARVKLIEFPQPTLANSVDPKGAFTAISPAPNVVSQLLLNVGPRRHPDPEKDWSKVPLDEVGPDETVTITLDDNVGAGQQIQSVRVVFASQEKINATTPVTSRITGDFGDGRDILSAFGPVAVPLSVGMGSGDDEALGTTAGDTVEGGAGSDRLFGARGADSLAGGEGDDLLVPTSGTGADGNDTIDGGDGDRDKVSYVFPFLGPLAAPDAVLINLATGVHGGAAKGDRLFNLEQFEGSIRNDTFIGRGANEVFEGNLGNDSILSGAGDDMLFGGGGADTLNGESGMQDVASYVESEAAVSVNLATGLGKGGEAEGDRLSNIEWLIGSGHADTLAGSSVANRIDGGGAGEKFADENRNNIRDAGENFIDANNNKKWDTGFDSMVGGAGNDTYVVSNSSDKVVEARGEGNDVIESPVSFTLPDHVEQLFLTGAVEIGDTLNGASGKQNASPEPAKKVAVASSSFGGITAIKNPAALLATLGPDFFSLIRASLIGLNGTGNIGNNTLVGNNGINQLDGREGDDSMVGNGGDDTYVVDSAGDSVVEVAAGGLRDTVRSSVTFTLPDHVENLTLTGTSALNGTGNSSGNLITGNSADNGLRGLDGDDTLQAGGGRDFLWGSAGNDLLDGGFAADFMEGEAGNDTYIVDNAGDQVLESAGRGTDEIVSSVAFTLPDHVENLALTGTSALNGTGNSSANRLTGNAAANGLSGLAGNDTLDGGAGADTMTGGAGDDLYVVDNVADQLIEVLNEGTDTVRSSVTLTLSDNFENLELTGAAALAGTGNSVNNRITGNSGSNRLDGGAGADTLVGGAGSDTYVVDQAPFNGGGGDVVIEQPGQGDSDAVFASVSHQLAANVENLILVGALPIAAGGNSLANRLVGNMAANLLDGRDGADNMTGGAGDDTYVVDNASDRVTESLNEGTDTVRSSVTHTLGDNLEILELTGTGTIHGTGNALANRVTGSAGNNSLNGGAAGSTGSGLTLMFFDGADTLDGGAGADTMSGGYDDDTYIVADPGDVVVEANLLSGGIDTVRSSVSFTLPANVERLVLTDSAASGTGNGSNNTLVGNDRSSLAFTAFQSNTLIGMGGNDSLSGEGGNDTLTGCDLASSTGGRGEIDTLTGGAGSDLFVLGARVGSGFFRTSVGFYEDGVTGNAGRGDYALITDFNPNQDKLQLAGSAGRYFMNNNTFQTENVAGTRLWREDGGIDELIAIIQPAPGASLTTANTINNASFV